MFWMNRRGSKILSIWTGCMFLLLAILLLGGIKAAGAQTPAPAPAGRVLSAPGRNPLEETGSITIAKNAEGGGDTLFYFTGDLIAYMITDASVTFGGLATGDYTITETVPDGWLLSAVICEGGSVSHVDNGVTIHLGAGDHVTCTWTNTKIMDAISIVKLAKNAGEQQFYFSGDLGLFSLSAGDKGTSFDLAAGDYTILEIVPDGWILTAITCQGGDVTTTAVGVIVHLDPGEYITCTFNNHVANNLYLPLVIR